MKMFVAPLILAGALVACGKTLVDHDAKKLPVAAVSCAKTLALFIKPVGQNLVVTAIDPPSEIDGIIVVGISGTNLKRTTLYTARCEMANANSVLTVHKWAFSTSDKSHIRTVERPMTVNLDEKLLRQGKAEFPYFVSMKPEGYEDGSFGVQIIEKSN